MIEDDDQEDNPARASAAELSTRAQIEKAKATQAVAKAVERGIDLTESLGHFLDRIFGPTAVELGGLLHDWVRFKRENLEKTRHKTYRILDQRGVEGDLRRLSLKHGIPLIEQASLEDDELLQDMWAGLIANSVDPGKRFTLRKLFISLLSELEPLDARVLGQLCRADTAAVSDHHRDRYTLTDLQSELNVDERDLKLSLLNLYRNGLVMDQRAETIASLDATVSGLRIHDEKAMFQATSLGFEVVQACAANEN